MRLYVCWGTFRTFGSGHPCRNALDALRAAGHHPAVVKSYGWGALPAALNATEGRREALRRTGKNWVPLLVGDDDSTIAGSKAIIQWARENPATELS